MKRYFRIDPDLDFGWILRNKEGMKSLLAKYWFECIGKKACKRTASYAHNWKEIDIQRQTNSDRKMD